MKDYFHLVTTDIDWLIEHGFTSAPTQYTQHAICIVTDALQTTNKITTIVAKLNKQAFT